MKQFLMAFWEVTYVVAIVLGSILFTYAFLIQPFSVDGASMEPTFSSGDFVVIDKVSYRFREPARGDVIVFESPEDEKAYFIKRIVGLPGESVSIVDGQVSIGGRIIEESYINPEDRLFFKDSNEALEADEYFVMGDNRSVSSDSRFWGPLKKEKIIGLVWVRVFPIGSFGYFEAEASKWSYVN